MLSRFLRQYEVPPKYRANFHHLYLDIAWFGVLSGSAVNFLNVYAARLGATGLQIGLLGATSAAVSLFLAIPAGLWIERRHTGRAVFWASIFFRLGYALWIPLPWLFDDQGQVRALILLTLLMAIPLTPLGVGFNALFAESVPAEYRAHVAGYRNVTFAVSFMFTSLVSGLILKTVSFPLGYQVIFLIGTIGAAMSSYHLYHIKPLGQDSSPDHAPPLPARPRTARTARSLAASLRLDIWSTPFKRVLLGLFGYHLTQYLAAPLFSIYYVRRLHLSDDEIGLGTALFYLTVLVGSTQLRNIAHRLGHKSSTGVGVAGMAFYPLAIALSSNPWHFYLTSFIGGFIFSISSGSYANYLLENTPVSDRPAHLAWYNIVLNGSILIGSLAGPYLAGHIGLSAALLVFAGFRLLSGLVILKWG
jgi:MFS family permease